MNFKKIFIPIVAAAAGVFVAFLFPQDKPATSKQHAQIKEKILPIFPELQSKYDQALDDGQLTKSEVQMILDSALKLVDSKKLKKNV